jgi:hypothetical protein
MALMTDMNERIRLRGRQRPAPVPEPVAEPAASTEPFDYGAGPRPPVRSSDPDAMRRWLSQQFHRSRQESVTVNARQERR